MKKMTIYFVLFWVAVISSITVFAQDKHKVTGVVADSTNRPISNVSVLLKGTTKGTATNDQGQFSIEVANGDVLVFSALNYAKQELTVGSATNYTIQLQGAIDGTLNEVVVTALGIKKNTRNLSYVAQSVSNAELTAVKDGNFTNALTGKAANVTITQGSGGAGAATNIILRGNNSLSGSGSPLIVIDGIPVVNNNTRPATGQAQFGENFLAPDQLSTINPSDVEDVTILKGATAAALYGAQAANGAILITTKSGKNGQMHVGLSTNTTFLNAMYHPQLQTEYGGATADQGSYSWGPKDPNAQYAGSFYKDFLRTGLNSANAVDFSTGNKNAQLYGAYSNTYAKGIVPNNWMKRNNFDLKGTSSLFDNFIEITGKFSYMNQTIQNPYSPGQYLNPYFSFLTIPANTNMALYGNRNNLVLDTAPYMNWPYPASTGTDNPYWDAYKVITTDNLNRMILNGNVKFNFTSWLNLMIRGNFDQTNEDYMHVMYQGTNVSLASGTGGFNHITTKTNQTYGDAILTFNKALSSDWHLTALGGAAIRDYKQTGINVNTARQPMFNPNVFITSNVNFAGGSTAQDVYDRRQVQSLFYSVEFGYKSALYLTTTGRNDWSSTLPSNKNNYFYPSVGLSAVLTDLFKGLSSETMNFLKLRAGYTQVGNDLPSFIINPVSTIGAGGAFIPPSIIIKPGTIIRPEMTNSFEAGFDVNFFNSLVKLNATYYKSNTKNQLFTVSAPPSSGYTSYYVNGGNIQNSGVELTLAVSPKLGPVNWTSTVNFSKNVNKVQSLMPGINFLIYSQLNNSTSYYQQIVPGGSLGDFYAKRFQRNSDGSLVLNTFYLDGVKQTGQSPVLDPTATKVGNAYPDFLLSWGNQFNYKNLRFSFLVDGRFGGKVISMTQAMMDMAGSSVQSAKDRDNGYVLVNGQQSADVKGFYQSKGGIGGALGEYLYSATAVRMREVSIMYSLPSSLYQKTKYIKAINVGLIGRNLFFFHKAAPIDPEIVSNNTMGQNAFLGLEMYNLPSTRNIGFSVNVNF